MTKKISEPLSFPLRLSDEVERLFDEIIHRPWGFAREFRGWNPSVDLRETADAFIIEADLPGVKKEDVHVEVQNSQVQLEGWRSREETDENGQFHTIERASGHFLRRLALPESVEKNAIQAEFKDGVLRIILAKVKTTGGAR
jgi:HSP20 family molecular chaperone IbpA